MKYQLLIFLFSFLSCVQKADNNSFSNKNLQGEWIGNNMQDQGVIRFEKDSAYYPYYQKSFKYKTTNDSLWIFFPDKTISAKFLVLGDTLLLYFENSIDTCWRKVTAR